MRHLRVSKLTSVLAVSIPVGAYLTFPSALVHHYGPLYRLLAPFAPADTTWPSLPTGCQGVPYGRPDAKLYQLVHDLGSDQAVFSMVMTALAAITAGRLLLSVARGASPSPLPIWTLCVAVASVSGWTFATLLALTSAAAVTAP